MDLCLSNQEMNFLIDGVEEGIRNDGRGYEFFSQGLKIM